MQRWVWLISTVRIIKIRMRIRAILRFRNEDLTRKRLIAGFKRQEDLANFLGIWPSIVSAWETFRNYPKKKELIKALEQALNCEIDEMFPPEFIKAIENKIGVPIEKVIDVKRLPEYTRGGLLLPGPEEAYELKERMELVKEGLEESLGLLTEREAKVLKLRFGLFEYKENEHTLQGIANIFRVTQERIRQIEAKALRKLKHPSRNESLKNFI